MMPESPGLYLRLTVLENLQCFAGLYELDDVRGRAQVAPVAQHLCLGRGDQHQTCDNGKTEDYAA